MVRSRQPLVAAVGSAMQAYQRSTGALDDAAADRLAVNRTDLRGLDWLFDGPTTVGQLGQATGLSSAATTKLLDRLERKGLVRRLRDTSDRRKVLVEMTELGRRLAGEIYGPLAQEGAGLLKHLGDHELNVIREYLEASRQLTDRHRERVRR